MNFRPLGNRVLIKQEEALTKTAGGLYIPENSQHKPLRGTVVAVGPGEMTPEGKEIVMHVTVGNVVLLAYGAGMEVEIDREKYIIINANDILGVLD